MTRTTRSRVKAAKQAVYFLVDTLPLAERSMKRVANLMGINSAHISFLVNHDYLTPALERGLILVNALPPRPDPIPVEPCQECGEVHVLVHCAYKRAQQKGRPRFSVAANNPEMALQQLERYYPGMFILMEET